jgi:hypothetical protein
MKQDTQIMYKCSIEEKKNITDYAKSIGLSVSSFVRMCALEKSKSKLS